MEHHSPLVGCGDRFGAQVFAARRRHCAHRQIGVVLAQHLCHHLAAVVDFRHDAIGGETVIGGATRADHCPGVSP